MRSAPATVACVPAIEQAGDQPTPSPRRFVAATDLSNAGNAAVAWALGMVPPEGSVTIVHVIEEREIDVAGRQRIAEGLRRMGMDRRLTERHIDLRFELVESSDPAAAITRIAERDAADLICVASQGRSRLPRILLGAVAQELLLSSRIPVLVVPPPRT
ncbi:MAG: universal stress protein [Acidobacteria bacterium]|nr:universal stress protein [Acidobacteriota bacterium]